MAYQFRQHYTPDEARALLPQLRAWLKELQQFHQRATQSDERVGQLLASGAEVGGPLVNQLIQDRCKMRRLLAEFARREIQIKDLDRGLIDFPAFVSGREVFLCWEQDEDDIEYWHDLDTGYAGREKL